MYKEHIYPIIINSFSIRQYMPKSVPKIEVNSKKVVLWPLTIWNHNSSDKGVQHLKKAKIYTDYGIEYKKKLREE